MPYEHVYDIVLYIIDALEGKKLHQLLKFNSI